MNKSYKAFSGLAGILLLAASAQAQTVSPYLQAVTPQSIVVNWKTNTAVAPKVRFGTTGSNLSTTTNGTTQTMSDVGYPANYHYHTVKLSGLQPNTKYYYRAVGGNDSSQVFSFKTLPLPGQAATANGHLRLLIMGDNQIKAQPRYDSLMVLARRKMQQLYGPDFNEQISMILNLGDQVDVGTLDHYENVHLAKSRYLSNVLPIQTAIGNHETYGTLQLQAYFDHFVLDSMQYKGIYSGTEEYYAFQAGNVLIAYMNTENTSTAQLNWVKKVVDTANTDPTVKWIVTIAHRPYQAEQYVGDISPWIRNTVVPYIANSPKYFMHVGAHHHIYARGQLKNQPVYNIISGGTAWDQYWGMAVEQDFDDVQKTISNWAYQIMDVDLVNNKVDVKVYSIGSIYGQKENVLIDSFHRYLGQPAPSQPSVTNSFPDSVQLPLTITGSNYQTSGTELLNSTQFQVSTSSNFSTVVIDKLRDYEDLFGNAGSPDSSIDVNAAVDIRNYTVPTGALSNGWHYVRLRHRDRNLEWSPWSATDSFKVWGSTQALTGLALDTNVYPTGDTIYATHTNGPGNPKDWVGIYRKGQTPGPTPSTTWKYVVNSATNGVLPFTLSNSDEYFAAYFENDGYGEIAPRVPFYHGVIPQVSTDTTNYSLGDTVHIAYNNAPGLSQDWIGVYKVGMVPGDTGVTAVKWSYVSGNNGVYNVTGLGKGFYFTNYFIRDGFIEPGQRAFFSVGDTITTLNTNKTIYNLGEYITCTWVDGPGIPKDWLGVYRENDNPNIDPLLSYTYIDGQAAGTKVLGDSAIPQQTGKYFVALFTNDSYKEVSNRVVFEVIDTTTSVGHISNNEHGIRLYPNPVQSGAQSFIESDYPIDAIEILDAKGQPVFRTNNIHKHKFSLLHQDLPAGMYFIRVHTRKLYTVKFIVR